MRSPEEQQQFLEHGRFREKPGGIPKWTRIGCVSILGTALAIVATVLGLGFLGRHVTKKVAADRRAIELGPRPLNYGYSVEAYRWNNEGFLIRLWSGDRLNDIRLDFPALALVNVHRRSWLSGGRALLLGIDTEAANDSLHITSEMLVLYDFAKGNLRTCGLQGFQDLQIPKDPTDPCRDLRAFAATLE